MDVRRIAISAVLVVLMFTPGFALARGGGNWMGLRGGTGPDRGSTMQRHDTLQACQMHCQATTTALEQLTARLKEADESNDPVQMRDALDQAQQPLTAMKDHMGMCVQKMSMMQQMQGGMGSQTKEK